MTAALPQHIGMNLAVEMVVQEALVLGLQVLRQDEPAMRELVRRQDELVNSSAGEWGDAALQVLRRMLDPADDMSVRVLYGYPESAQVLPCYSIIKDSASENTSEAVMGDILQTSYERVGGRSIRTDLKGVGMISTVQVGCWAVAPEAAFLLEGAVRWALFRMKDHLRERGIHEHTWSESGVVPAIELEPRVGYVPMHSLQLKWTFGQSVRRDVPFTATLAAGKFRN